MLILIKTDAIINIYLVFGWAFILILYTLGIYICGYVNMCTRFWTVWLRDDANGEQARFSFFGPTTT